MIIPATITGTTHLYLCQAPIIMVMIASTESAMSVAIGMI